MGVVEWCGSRTGCRGMKLGISPQDCHIAVGSGGNRKGFMPFPSHRVSCLRG
ncbi:hypothetical protein GMO_22830 [Gluconobacter morbifer G707]|uniref:Uncharacterized protein n=1 Tax=Gluconobacter morbifer G707 TaxID=1088869 RepID=G6XLN4_9PROT|nr:hypothetical protein GMO_22830 [Gluconobacter morbifer G707]